MKENRNQDEGNRKKRKFEGKIIVISGVSSGIGRQAALDFVNEDAGSIILIARSESKLHELKRTLQEPKRAEIAVLRIKEDLQSLCISMNRLKRIIHLLITDMSFFFLSGPLWLV